MTVQTDCAEAVVRAACTGKPVQFGAGVLPDLNLGLAENVVRGDLIRDVLFGVHCQLHPRGLRVSGLTITGDMDLSYGTWRGRLALVNCRLLGGISLLHARAEGTVRLDGSHLSGTLVADAATVSGSLLLDGVTALRGMQGVGLKVVHTLSLEEALLQASDAQTDSKVNALELFRASIGDLVLDAAEVRGGAYCAGLLVAGDLRCRAATLTSRERAGWPDDTTRRAALDLSGARVSGAISLCGDDGIAPANFVGPLVLSGVSCKEFGAVKALASTGPVDIDGLVYERLAKDLKPVGMRQIICGSSVFSQQPYTQLAQYCDKTGQLAEKRRTLMALEKCTTLQAPPRSWARVWRSAYGWLVGYGYRPGLALGWLLGCVVLSALLVHFFGSTFLALKPSALQPPASAVPRGTAAAELAIDALLPFASLGAKELWFIRASDVESWFGIAAFLLLKLAAWGLAALALASVTGLARKL